MKYQEEYEKRMSDMLLSAIVVDTISLPKMENLVKEYDSLSNRHWKRKRQLEHSIFWVAYKNYKNNLTN